MSLCFFVCVRHSGSSAGFFKKKKKDNCSNIYLIFYLTFIGNNGDETAPVMSLVMCIIK